MKKGFTLIELLAVIVILAIIALIAIPQISNLINDVRAKSLLSSANGLYDSARLYNMKYQNEDTVRFDIENNNITTFADKKIEYKGSIKKGIVVINDIGKVALCVTDGVNSAYKELDDTKVSLAKNRTCSISSALTVNLNNSKKETIKADIEVDNVEALKALSINVDKIVHTKGYYNAGDGGDAYYKIISTMKNNARYFKIANGNVAELMPQNNTFNVKQFGAKGDGITDEKDLLKSIFTIASGYKVYFPKGTYITSGTIYVKSDTTITGEGSNSIIMAIDDIELGRELMRLSNAKNVRIENITFDGNIESNSRDKGHSSSTGIQLLGIWNSDDVYVENVVFKDNVNVAVTICQDGSNIVFKNNKFLNVDCGIEILGAGNVKNLLIEDNYFDGHYSSEPISMYGTGTFRNIIINNNIIKNKTHGSAIYIGYAGGRTYGAKITNNKIYDCAHGVNVKYADDVLVENNYVDFSGMVGDKKGGSGIKFIESSNTKVLNNKIVNAGQFAIRNESGTNMLYKGNVVENGALISKDYTFVDFFGTNNNVVFEQNKISRLDSTLTSHLLSVSNDGGITIKNNQFENGKIWLRKTSANIIVSGNNVEVRDEGTNNVITN